MLGLLAVAVITLALAKFRLDPAVAKATTGLARHQAELQQRERAFDTLKKLIASASDDRRAGFDGKGGGDIQGFWLRMETELRQRALGVGFDVEVSVQSNSSGQPRTDGLLPIPKEVAEEVYFEVRGRATAGRLENYFKELERMPVAISGLSITNGGDFVLFLTGWAVK